MRHRPDQPSVARWDESAVSADLPSGEEIRIRPLRADDNRRFGAYLAGLSETTRSLWGPHPFDQATADQICASLGDARTRRIVATVTRDGDERIIAYVLLEPGARQSDRDRYAGLGLHLDETCASFAPSVADDYQGLGVGSVVMEHILEVARRKGLMRIVLWGGVQARNGRAIRFYTRWGFCKVGSFFNGIDNDDMLLDLTRSGT